MQHHQISSLYGAKAGYVAETEEDSRRQIKEVPTTLFPFIHRYKIMSTHKKIAIKRHNQVVARPISLNLPPPPRSSKYQMEKNPAKTRGVRKAGAPLGAIKGHPARIPRP
ncbi:hypothetical protein JTE90_002698 [Oedothorax gibbosus]|uniref:Uncharacterized protein n=1 Tax=Oedothorax gibbosus TaxID=931172 RepID=A0AAV6VY95_9ARAC|nr:hypothetical protein JTE90_002698 [Oedothorax gibbosus]